MKRYFFSTMAMMLAPITLSAVDGVVLINQSTVMAGGGFPFKITLPGSYRLTSNLMNAPAGKNGIEITADDVTIDLNGFAVMTTLGGGSEETGICGGVPLPGEGGCITTSSHTTVLNGSVTGFGLGIVLGNGATVENVRVSSQPGAGISVGTGSIVKNNVSDNNNGVFVACPGVVIGNVVLNQATTSSGLFTRFPGCTLIGNAP